MHVVMSVETNIKWNGATSEFFRPSRGIRQGDPISSYIFVLCLDKLSHLITLALDDGNWRAIRVGKKGLTVSHLMFVDDLLLFGKATAAQMKYVTSIFDKLSSMSGQQVSHEKTRVYFSKNVNRSK
ncbi:uncharacterized mitochondrial protein AtMg01250-like [Vicia villosa]|uniref:uncharacterized mitochondrial protein AtMg01250-like n=1 Tax=Vicia villosa TaxID=3911 RepID=UPI00273B1044|nr:uncharacterized mitochondrial protein AtMg01250-like [Vicia villosa]